MNGAAKLRVVDGGQPARGESFVQVPASILEHPDISPGDFRVYCVLLSYAWDKRECFPTQADIGERAHMKIRSVQYHLNRLRTLGLIEVLVHGKGRANVYQIAARQAQRSAHTHNAAPEHTQEVAGGYPQEIAQQVYTGEIDTREIDSTGSRRRSESAAAAEVEPTLCQQIARVLEIPEERTEDHELIFATLQRPEYRALPFLLYAQRCRSANSQPGKQWPRSGRVNSWINWLERATRTEKPEKLRSSGSSPPRQAATETAEEYPPSGVPVWDELCRHMARLNGAMQLPCRQLKDWAFEQFRPVGFRDGVLTLEHPPNFHPYDCRKWPPTIVTVASEEMDLTIAVAWA